MREKTFYITTPIFYPNAKPHLGHAYVALLADVAARYHRILEDDTYFLTGTDENSEKVIEAAERAGKKPAAYADAIVEHFRTLYETLGISYDQFIRTSDEDMHWKGVEAFWKKLKSNGDIYKSEYKGLYCVGAESFVTEKDLIDGKCPDHDERPIELSEENYFFRLSKYTALVKEKIVSGELSIVPKSREREILALLDGGLSDVSFSRPRKNIPWGVQVPNDKAQTVYVWCDALVSYISALGFGKKDDELFSRFWPASCHMIGKDILRFHAAIWPAMLLSADLPLPKQIFVHGMILSGGRKMSKTLGNVIDPQEVAREYGGEALRYFLAREISPMEDGDMTMQKFKDAYNANLANGLGNVVARVMRMAEAYEAPIGEVVFDGPKEIIESPEASEYRSNMESMHIDRAADVVWSLIAFMDSYIAEEEPFKTITSNPEKAERDVLFLVERLWEVAALLTPLMPETASAIQRAIRDGKKPPTLFGRKQ